MNPAVTLVLFALFSDHMVLQRNHSNPIWGWDRPGQEITLTVEGAPGNPAVVHTIAGPDGAWRLSCPVLPAGGPYRLKVHGSQDKVIDDVDVGDVWLASGQSNMEFTLSQDHDANAAIKDAKNPAIRVVKVPRLAAQAPLDRVEASWSVSSPEAAGAFTAVGYYFAREIQKSTGVPIGIIDSTWGGTRVEAWASREGLHPVMAGLDDELGHLVTNEADLAKLRAEYDARVLAWEKSHFPQDTGISADAANWKDPKLDDRSWETMTLPGSVQSHGYKANGAFWFRTRVNIPAAWAGHDLTLSLGAIDDFDDTFFDGDLAGRTREDTPDAYRMLRHYTIPGSKVHAGESVIAVRVFDRYGDGGMMGPSGTMTVESSAQPDVSHPLAGSWRWKVERVIPLVSGSVYATSPQPPPGLAMPNSATALYNGMIAPLVPYGLRGFIWYQGEANTATYATYRDRFTAMIRDWRTRWGEGNLPFYFVQLASFTESPDWPFLREAQTGTLSEPDTGMAVILDIGEEHDIHPKDKRDVGHRLALIARAGTYGEHSVVSAGPTMTQVEINGGAAIVHYSSAKGLRTHDGSAEVKGFALAGADGVYHSATAHIDHDSVVVSSREVPAPQSVRYAWSDWVVVNLENADGLPAAPFRTDGFAPR
ncbi:MAG TPA: sialate O-acetylesterase [Candidatus Didemnitutus sp.]|nr:sialate O-acetylesterase [Candidatus Didemnitutus sp.]